MASEGLIKQEIEKKTQELQAAQKRKDRTLGGSFTIALLESEISILMWVLHE